MTDPITPDETVYSDLRATFTEIDEDGVTTYTEPIAGTITVRHTDKENH